jgi:ABC-type Fe3+-hydroxamate transport system substrate-binding protein
VKRDDDAIRVVSLVPSATETLRAWGVEPLACTRFCEQPDLPHVGGTKDPDIDAVVALSPDLVVMDEEENRWEDAEALADAGVAVVATAVRSVGDVPRELARLADAVDVTWSPPAVPSAAREVVARAFVPIWRKPYMTINRYTYGSSLLEHVGVDNIFGSESTRYPEVTLMEAAARDPDVVLAPSEPYPFTERQRDELESCGAPVLFVDGKDLFWWGVRTWDALRRLPASLRV